MVLGNLPVYLSTFLLERNRWNGKGPSLLVSEWLEPAVDAGFRGMEVWFPHLFFESRSEWESIREKSGEFDLPIVFFSLQLPTDASDKSRRQRESLTEAVDYFSPQGVKFTLAEGGESQEKQLSFLGEWARDLPRGVQLVRVFDGKAPKPGEIALHREKLGARFRCALNPFSVAPGSVEAQFGEAGDSIVNLGAKVLLDGKHRALRSAEKVCAPLISFLHRIDFNGSWSLESTGGVGEPGEDIDRLFDQAEDDLNFLASALLRK